MKRIHQALADLKRAAMSQDENNGADVLNRVIELADIVDDLANEVEHLKSAQSGKEHPNETG